jgi:hypothetical protein
VRRTRHSVAEVEDVRDPLALAQVEAVKTDLGALRNWANPESAKRIGFVGVPGMGVFVASARPELAVQPEGVQVVVVPIERGLEREMDVNERLVAANRDRPVDAGEAHKVGLEYVDMLRHVALISPRASAKLLARADGQRLLRLGSATV